MRNKCPGQDSRELKAELYPCPNCGTRVEIFSDEHRQRCPNCRTMVFTEETPTCIQWCKAAEECLGPERYRQAMERLKGADADEHAKQAGAVGPGDAGGGGR